MSEGVRSTGSKKDLKLVAALDKSHDDRVIWSLFVGSAKFDAVMSDFGNMAVRLDPAVEDSIPWPTTGDDGIMGRYLASGIAQARHFVADCQDLAVLFAAEGYVQRGAIRAWLTPSSFPGRLVKARILARDIGDTELEKSVLRKLGSGPLELPDEETIDVGKSAAYWAKHYGKALGFDVVLN